MGDERVLLLYICHIDNIDVSFGRLLCLGVPGKWVMKGYFYFIFAI